MDGLALPIVQSDAIYVTSGLGLLHQVIELWAHLGRATKIAHAIDCINNLSPVQKFIRLNLEEELS